MNKVNRYIKKPTKLTVTLNVSREQDPPDVVDSRVDEGPSNVKDSKSRRK